MSEKHPYILPLERRNRLSETHPPTDAPNAHLLDETPDQLRKTAQLYAAISVLIVGILLERLAGVLH